MSIEAGARAGMIAPDQTTFDYIKGRPHAPEGEDWDRAVEYWSSLASDEDAVFDAGQVNGDVQRRAGGHRHRGGAQVIRGSPHDVLVEGGSQGARQARQGQGQGLVTHCSGPHR